MRDRHISFQKPARLIDRMEQDIHGCVAEIFRAFSLQELRHEIRQWCDICLISEESAYEEETLREDLMNFCNSLLCLAEALHLICEERKSKGSDRWKAILSSDLRTKLGEYNKPRILSPGQKAHPLTVLREFRHSFSQTYATRELWDMLEAVIAYEGERALPKTNLLLTYQCLLVLIKAPELLTGRP